MDQKAAIERMRTALEHIASLPPVVDEHTGYYDQSAQDTAKGALADCAKLLTE